MVFWNIILSLVKNYRSYNSFDPNSDARLCHFVSSDDELCSKRFTMILKTICIVYD